MLFLFLAGQNSIHLPSRLYLGLLQLIAEFCLADRSGGLIRRNPWINPLRPCPERSRDDSLDWNGLIKGVRMQLHAICAFRILERRTCLICAAIAFMNNGGTQLPICFMPSSNSPANRNSSGKDPNRLNSGSENRRHSAQCIAPPIPRLLSMRLMV